MLKFETYEGSHLLESMKEDPTIIGISHETVYFTLKGVPTFWVIPEELIGKSDLVMQIIETIQANS